MAVLLAQTPAGSVPLAEGRPLGPRGATAWTPKSEPVSLPVSVALVRSGRGGAARRAAVRAVSSRCACYRDRHAEGGHLHGDVLKGRLFFGEVGRRNGGARRPTCCMWRFGNTAARYPGGLGPQAWAALRSQEEHHGLAGPSGSVFCCHQP